jgi:hypothetical protein
MKILFTSAGSRRSALLAAGGAVLTLAMPRARATAAAGTPATLFKDPDCTCCENYGAYLATNGYIVTVVKTTDLAGMNRAAGVPAELEGCHIVKINGYLVEGHVPIEIVTRLLTERPAIKGISLPGMPAGAPGMDGEKAGPFNVYEIPADGLGGEGPKIYAVE